MHTFTSRWLVLLVQKDLFQWISSIYRHYQMRGEWLHHTWIFLSISIYRMRKTLKSAKSSADKHSTDKLLMGNEGCVIEIQYLERAFCTNIYLIDKVTGSLFAVHDDHIESTGLCGSECVFDLQELEFNICDLADRRHGEDDSVAEKRWSTQTAQHQTPDAPPSSGPPTIPDNFPMYENWENFTHQGESFTISYRQQIYETHSEIITTLIDCFSALNKHTSSHPETELACH